MTQSTLKYASERVQLKTPTGFSAESEGIDFRINGRCPRCEHDTAYTSRTQFTSAFLHLGIEDAEARAASLERRLTISMECDCRQEHPAETIEPAGTQQPEPSWLSPPSRIELVPKGCGRYWSLSIEPQTTGELKVEPAADFFLIEAAETVRRGANPELSRIRMSAEKWIAGITALFGLFTLAGVIGGVEEIRGLGEWTAFERVIPARSIFGLLVALSVVFAGAAVNRGYRAAYGWPTTHSARTNAELALLYRRWRVAPARAARDLRWGVRLAGLSLAAIVLAVFVLWYAPQRDAGASNVRITLDDQSRRCGTLLRAGITGAIRIRDAGGEIQAIELDRVVQIEGVDACS